MKAIKIIFLIFLELALVQKTYVFAQYTNDKETDYICWSKDIKLEWSDFQGEPDSLSIGKAGCAAELIAQGFWDEGLPNFRVSNCFDMLTSWTTDTISLCLLEHERLHFDIAEVHARRMRRAIDSLREEGVNSFDPYSEMVQFLLNRRNEIDSLYDTETAHGVYTSRQDEWKKKIWKELKSLEKYAESECPE